MEKNNKRRQANSLMYITLAFILVTVMVIGIISMVTSSYKETRTDTDMTMDTGEDYNVDPRIDKDTTGAQTQTTAPRQTDPVSEESRDTPTEAQVAAPMEYYLPVTGYISKDYSMELPVFSVTMNDYRTHSGIDICATEGSAVCCFADGVVSDRYTDPFMGVCVEVSHEGGMISKYMGLAEEYPADAEVGCNVYGGQPIGAVGISAAIEAADDPHLHFEVMSDQGHLDPLDYVECDVTEDNYEE